MMSLKSFILTYLEKGFSPKDIYYLAVSELNYDGSIDSFKNYVKKTKYQNKNSLKIDTESEPIDKDLFISKIKSLKVCTFKDMVNFFKKSSSEIYNEIIECRKLGYDILVESDKIIYDSNILPEVDKIKRLENKEIVFGVITDPHFGSKACQITAINEFSEICSKQGVKHIFVPGDVLAGNNVYPGQIYDIYGVSAEEQINSCIRNLPLGFDYYIIGGNHDYSFVKKSGQNPLLVLSSLRNDIHYLGFDEVDIPILKNVDVKLWHPAGGVPYSASYRLQKGIEQITLGELQSIVRGVKDRPTVRFVLAGHLHIQVQAMFGSIFGAQCGTFEGQTNYLKRLGLVPSIGGYIIKASLGSSGFLKNFEAKFYIFDDILNDYLHYEHSITPKKEIKPIFE